MSLNENNKLSKKEDLFNPLRNIWNEIPYKNISTFNDLNKILNENKVITNGFNNNINMGFFHSITQYNNMNLCISIGMNKKDSFDFYTQKLKNNYSLYGMKSFTFSYNMIIKILYQLLYFQNIYFNNQQELKNYIQENLTYLCNNENISINVLILVSKKSILHNINEINKNSYSIIMPSDINEKYMMCGLFFCDNSIKILEKQNIDKFMEFHDSRERFAKYENYIRNNVPINERHKFMINSSVVLYTLGARESNDLDLYIHKIPETLANHIIKEKTDGELKFLDIKIKNTSLWPSHWDIWLDEWAQLSKAKYFEEIIANDEFHYYFLGLKITSLETDIARRLVRLRPAAIADLIILKECFNLNINIPTIPEKQNIYKKIDDLNEESILFYQNNNTLYNEKTREFILEKEININKFQNTVTHYLKTRYNYDTQFRINNSYCNKSLSFSSVRKLEKTNEKKDIVNNSDKKMVKIRINNIKKI